MWKLLLPYGRRVSSISSDRFSGILWRRFSVTVHYFTSSSTAGDGVMSSGSSRDRYDDKKYPSGEFVYKRRSAWENFAVRTRLFFALPWERFKEGSVLTILLRGEITDQLKSFPRVLSLPQICENFEKAAYDPRVAGIYLHIDALKCGWGKLDEIQRRMLDFKKSGKFIIGYVPACGVKEYYIGSACDELYVPPSAYVELYGFLLQSPYVGGVLEKVGIEPQVQQIGKYKSVGELLSRKSMSDETREMMTTLLDNIYDNWLDKVSLAKEKKKEEIENFINQGGYQIERMKEQGLITDIKYDDEVISLLKKRMGIPCTSILPTVDYRKYCRVRKWSLGLSGNRDKIAVIRASGLIIRAKGGLRLTSSKIIAEQFIQKIRSLRVSKKYKAVIIRIDSPGGDALAADIIWREIKLLAASIPVIASMSDLAASGGYYMAMAADVIVAENLTLTGSVGVVASKTLKRCHKFMFSLHKSFFVLKSVGMKCLLVFLAKFNMGKLYESIGLNKEVISKGRYAELVQAEHRPFRADEAELFAKKAQHIYKQFRDKAAFSRSMTVDEMEKVAQGRVWTGRDGASLGLVDAVGGLSRAIAIAKERANIPQDKLVSIVELSRPSVSPLEILREMGNTVMTADGLVKDFIQEMGCCDEIQARMDGILFEKLDGKSALSFIKDNMRLIQY